MAAANEPSDSAGVLKDLALEIRVLAAAQAGRTAEALATLEQATLGIRYHYQNFQSPFTTRPFGRFLRAELLYKLGRYDDALGWYQGFVGGNFSENNVEFVYRGPTLLRSAEIHTRKRRVTEAQFDYERFITRWQDATSQLQPMVRAAQSAKRQLKP